MALLIGLSVLGSAGCDVNSFFDPSKTGYFGSTPVTMPVLDRIAAIEPTANLWGQTTSVQAEDLMPSDLTYRLHPGDSLEIEVYELYSPGQFFPFVRRVDQSGEVHVPELGPVHAAGLTVPQFQDRLVAELADRVMANPTVSVNLMTGGALTYILYGHVQQPGRFNIQDPNLKLMDAIAMAGGVPLSTRRVYVIRQVSVAPEIDTSWHGRVPDSSSGSPTAPTEHTDTVESLIQKLQNAPAPSPGDWPQDVAPPIDIEDVSPAPVTLPTVASDETDAHTTETPFVHLKDRDQWVRVRHEAPQDDSGETRTDLVVERVIEVPYKRLAHGDTSLNLIIRPGDQIYVDGPPVGYVYVSGEVTAPNAYPLPAADHITLSRLIAMAGGLGALAVPDRVDLVRQIDEGREATIRLDLGAIRRRTEPDVVIKPNDHVLVGTNWIAYPLAVMRNGFRVNYGFGFLLDRNFGNDVFGPPPVNFVD